MLFEDVRAAASRFVSEPAIRFGTDDDAACERISTPQLDAPHERLVLPRSESARKLDAQLFEELRCVDVGKAFKPPANDWPRHAERLHTGLAKLGVDGLRLL